MKLIHLAAAWLLGIVAGAWINPPVVFVVASLGVLGAFAFLWWRERSLRPWSLLALCFLLGLARFQLSRPQIDPNHVAYYNGRGEIALRGVVEADPDPRDRYTYLRIRASSLRLGSEEHQVHGCVLVQASRYPYRSYGDELELIGELQTPSTEDTHYREYLARRGIYAIMRYPKVTLLATGRGNFLYRALYTARRRANAAIAAILPEPEASVLAGILLGIESGIPKGTLDAFIATGMIHILVISGFNLTLLGGTLVRLGTKIANRRYVLLAALIGLLAYTFFVGANAPVVRALIMVSLSFLAYFFGRGYDARQALAAAALLMTMFDPRALWEASFQLSMMATLGLMVIAPALATRFAGGFAQMSNRANWWSGLLREVLFASVAAQLTTLPIILYHFGRLSLMTLIANALVLPVQPYVMISGGIATLVSLFWPPMGRALAWPSWLLLAYTTRVIEWMARPSWATLSLPFAGWMVWLWYALLFAMPTLWAQRKRAGQQLSSLVSKLARRAPSGFAFGSLGILCALVWAAVFRLPDGRLHVYFLDVGQGDAILIETPRGQQILLDGGPEPSRLLSALGRRLPFWDRELDMVVLTHSDMDHLGGLVPVLERYRIGLVVHTAFLNENPPTAYWQELITRHGMKAVLAERGMRFAYGDELWLEVWHPPPQPLVGTAADDNNNSLVLRLAYGQVSFLFTGDIQGEAERSLLASGPLAPCTVLKVSHHGAAEGSGAAFLAAVRPSLAVISVGAGNRHGHPARATLKRLEEANMQVLRTDQRGTIHISTDGTHLWLETEH